MYHDEISTSSKGTDESNLREDTNLCDYWNHNTAYHPWIVSVAREHSRTSALDVGCGDGLLAQRLAQYAEIVYGIDSDENAISRAQQRLRNHKNTIVKNDDFTQFDAPKSAFDLITFVASIHHMSLPESLLKARDLLKPGGDLLIVGLAANRTLGDWLFSATTLPFARLGSAMHHETHDIGVQTQQPHESLSEIHAVAKDLLPGASIQRGLYYRYLLRWTKPSLLSSHTSLDPLITTPMLT